MGASLEAFAVRTVFSNELQLTAKVVANVAILVAVLLRDVQIFGPYIFASFLDEGDYNVALRKCEHTAILVQGVIDLGEKISAKGI